MPFYNLPIDSHRLIFSMQPKCGSNSIRDWINLHIGKSKKLDSLTDIELTMSIYRHYKKVYIVRDPYERLVSFYGRFVIDPGNLYQGIWSFADHLKKIPLEDKSFSDFIHILQDLPQDQYQHHLVDQSTAINLSVFDEIIPLKSLNRYFTEHQLPSLPKSNRLLRYDYERSMVHTLPGEMRSKGVPAFSCFYDPQLLHITQTKIFAQDYILLGDYF